MTGGYFWTTLIAGAARKSGTEIRAYCLMPNHVHFIMAPSTEDSLRQTFAEARRRYTGRTNARFNQTGHLWQGRFTSLVMDERHVFAAARYVPMNPERVVTTGDSRRSVAASEGGRGRLAMTC